MRWVAYVAAGMVVALGACGSSAGSGSVDASPVPPAPPACVDGGSVPALPEVCFANGWCLDAPAPLAWATTSLADGNRLWFAALGHVIAIEGDVATPYNVGLGLAPRLSGGGAAGVWAHGDQTLYRFDGGQWFPVPVSGYIGKLVPVSPTRAWAMISGQLQYYDGSAWTTLSLAAELVSSPGRSVRIGTFGAIDSEVWVSAAVTDTTTYQVSYVLAHRSATGWTVHDAPDAATDIVAFSSTDVWLAGSAIYHYDGAQMSRVHHIYGARLRAQTPNDVWAFNGESIAHWDGVSWSECASSVTSLAPRNSGGTDVWGTRADGTVVHFDGTAWSATRTLPAINDLEAFTGQDVLALGGGVLLRHGAGGWHADATFPGTASMGLRSRGPQDVWAFGPSALHFDGSAWTDTQAIGPVYDLCQSDGNTALAVGPGGILAFDGVSWMQDSPVAAGSIFCLPGGDAFATMGASSQIAHRANGTWSMTPVDDTLVRTYSPAAGVLWSAGNTPPKRSAGPIWTEMSRGMAPFINTSINNDFTDVTGTSATDIYVLVNDDRILRHDGTSFVSSTSVTGVRQIFALAPGDLLLLQADFTTRRLQNGTISTIAPAIANDNVYFSAPVWFGSATSGFAVSDTGHLMRFTGTWARDTTFSGTAAGLAAFSATDVWTIANGNSIAHYNGSAWTVTALPGGTAVGNPAVTIWGNSTNDLWVGALDGKLWRVINGTPTAFAHGLGSDAPTVIHVIAGTAANDVWFSGRYLHQGMHLMTLFHWNGTTFTRHRTPRTLTEFKIVDGNVYARGWDSAIGLPASVWQYTANGWTVRTDLDVATLFGELALAERPPVYGQLVEGAATRPHWSSVGVSYPVEHGGLIWRQD